MICPKCGNKIKKGMLECPYCKEKAKNIRLASNLEAKKIIKSRGDMSKVVLSSTLPEDVSKKKLVLFSILFGWFGMHCFVVGRIKRGLCIALFLFFCCVCVLIPDTWVLHQYLSGIFAGLLGFVACYMWWSDILLICINKFKVPVVLNNYRD